MGKERDYQEIVAAAMEAAGVEAAIETGEPQKLTVTVEHAGAVFTLEMDFAPYPDKPARLRSTFTLMRETVRKMLDHDKSREALKVACCPTCTQWFETFAARNEHREAEHSAAAAARRALDGEEPAGGRLIKLEPHIEVGGGGMVEW